MTKQAEGNKCPNMTKQAEGNAQIIYKVNITYTSILELLDYTATTIIICCYATYHGNRCTTKYKSV